jgi:hypothetical protein
MLRLSTPCLIFLLLITLDCYKGWASQRKFPADAWVITLVLLIGACTPFNEMWRAFFFKPTVPNYGISLVEHHNNTEPPHYVGVLDRRDLTAVLREPTLVPSADERKRQGLWVAPPPKPR